MYDILNQDLIRRQGSEPFGGEVPDKHVVTIVTVARLMLQNKGQDLCIEASKILQNKGYRFQWFLWETVLAGRKLNGWQKSAE